MALKGVFQDFHKAHPGLYIYNVTSDKYYTTVDNLPNTMEQFNKNFVTVSHFWRTGGGKLHIHFNVPEVYPLINLKQSPQLMHYLRAQQIWLVTHQFTDTNIATAGFIFMKSPMMTHLDDYVKALKMDLEPYASKFQLSQENTSTTLAPENSHQEPYNNPDSDCIAEQTSATTDKIPHLELVRHSLTIRDPNPDTASKPLYVPVLELKCDQNHLHTMREVILQAQLQVRGYGIFIPPSFCWINFTKLI